MLFRQISAIALLLLYVGMQTAMVFPDKTEVNIQAVKTGTELCDNSDDNIKTEYLLQLKCSHAHAARYISSVYNLYLFEPQEPVLLIQTPPPRLV